MAIGLIALTPFTYLGTSYSTGQYFEVEPVHAAALTYQVKAKFGTPQEAARKTKRAYRRRDMVAETSAESE